MKHRQIILKALTCLVLTAVISACLGPISLFRTAEAQEQEDVVVTATIESWLDFSVSPTSTAIAPALVGVDGSVAIGSTGDIDLQVGTNNPLGWNVTIRGTNAGLYSTTSDHTITTVSSTSTLVAGTDGYGANATSTLGGATIDGLYNYYGSNTVGEIATTSASTLVDKSSANGMGSVANMQVRAAATSTTPAANDYSDTITLTASGGT